jgi:hypothetical protein
MYQPKCLLLQQINSIFYLIQLKIITTKTHHKPQSLLTALLMRADIYY